ncbi:MAG: amino acid permease [Caulobacterales bacterium]|nr:amino acid permease [Caulobacterales bacterium]
MSGRAHFSPATAVAVVVANMVGTGVFTSLGFQLFDIQSGFVLLALWAAGGVAALCGALSYAELGASFPRSGGEYNLLSRVYHPGVGFIGGWVSATIGFAAPVALASLAFGAYATSIAGDAAPPWAAKAVAVALIVILASIHAGRRAGSGGAQLIFTLIKFAVIVAFCVAAPLAAPALQPISFAPAPGDGELLTSRAFAVSLIFVGYAYAGWNAATYLSGEVRDPQRWLPMILGFGTAIVMALYLALNAVFLLVAPIPDMVGQEEIGYIAAAAAFGDIAGRLVGLVLAVLLVSTVSAMTIAGPRVMQVAGEDMRAFRFFARTNADGIPSRAVWTQSALALGFVIASDFESVLVFSGFTLALVNFATVLGVFVSRWREPDLARPFRTPAHPLAPLLFLAVTGWTLFYVLLDRPLQAISGLALMFVGGLVWLVVSRPAGAPRSA